MSRLVYFFFLLLLFFGIACSNKEQSDKEVNQENIYFDYKVTASEGDDNLTVMLQYRDGEGGDAISIKETGNVMLDDEPVPEGSTRMTGAFYELYKPVDSFTGKHSIIFTDAYKNEYKEGIPCRFLC